MFLAPVRGCRACRGRTAYGFWEAVAGVRKLRPVVSPMKDPELDALIHRFELRLPRGLAGGVRWVRTSSPWMRLPLAVAITGGGFLGFLPILGFWMVPLGLVLLAHDVPPLRRPMARMLSWVERKWPPR